MINQELGYFFSAAITGLKKIKEHTETKIEFYSKYGVFEDFSKEAVISFPLSEEYVNYEDNDIIRRCLKIDDENALVVCTEEEFMKVHDWIISYFNNLKDYPDIVLPCYDPNDNNLYQGNLNLTTIKEKGFHFTTVECDYPVARYDEYEDIWTEIVMTLWDDGTYILNPDGYCDRCVKFLSQEEKDKLPDFPEGYNYNNAYFFKYDFTTESWRDSRTLDELKNNFYDTVNGRFDDLLEDTARYYLKTGYTSSSKVLNIISDPITKDNEYYNYGVAEVSKVFNFSTDITITEDFSMDELKEMYFTASSLINGQRDAWLNLPNKLYTSSRYNLATNAGWDKITDKFTTWFSDMYD